MTLRRVTTNTVMDKKGDLVTDSHCILARYRKHFSQLLNIHGVNDVKQLQKQTGEPLVPKLSAFEVQMAIGRLNGTNHQVSVKSQQNRLNQGVQQCALRYIHLLILFGIRRNCLRSGMSRGNYWGSSMWISKQQVNY